MPNIEITNVDLGGIELRDGEFRDEVLNFAGTDTFLKGTLLARLAVALAVTASAVTGTGNGTVTAATVEPGVLTPKVGNWTLRATAAVANGGTFRLEDPDGAIVATGLQLTAGAGVATVFEVGGLRFTITDGATDFAVGDTFTLTVASVGKLVPFNPAGAGGAQKPVAVLTYDVSRTGAGDVKIRALVKGVVNKNRLLIDVDGNGNNITSAILDQLRDMGIVPIDVAQLSTLDNQ
jgi:hypothetical protein